MNGHLNNRLARLTLQSLDKRVRGRLAEIKLEIIAGTGLQTDLDYYQGQIDILKEIDVLMDLDAFPDD